MTGHRSRISFGASAAPLLEAGELDDEKASNRTPSILDQYHRASAAYFNDWPKSTASLVPTMPASLIQSSKTLLGRSLYFMIPSFIQAKIHSNPTPERIHPTAYLDGMRGLAAFAVYLCHLSYQFFFITYGYGQGEPGENAWLIQLPIIRAFYSGPPAVSIFFVISGYALSYKPLKQMRAYQYDGLLQTMSSSTFRRAFRLYLPCFFSTLMVFCMLRLRIYEYTRPFSDNRQLLRAKHEDHCIYFPHFYDQYRDFVTKWSDFIHVFDFNIYGGSMDYDRHLWTISTEFRASLALFVAQLMFARLRTALRIGSLFGLIYWALHWSRWEICLFWSGCILAELDLITLARAAVKPSAEGKKSTYHHLMRYFWIANFICGLYLASYPDDKGNETPGFIFLGSLIPKFFRASGYRFWASIGAVQVVWATNNTSVLKGLFTGPVVQYLGKLSYALYLMHGPLIHSFGYIVLPWMWGHTGVEPRFNYELGFFYSGLIITAVLIWVSDMFWRGVDIPCVKFARWLEGKCIANVTKRYTMSMISPPARPHVPYLPCSHAPREYQLHDPVLTPFGETQCADLQAHLRAHEPLAEQIDLIVTSPMRRTLQTTQLGLGWLIERGVPVLGLAEAQAFNLDAPSTRRQQHSPADSQTLERLSRTSPEAATSAGAKPSASRAAHDGDQHTRLTLDQKQDRHMSDRGGRSAQPNDPGDIRNSIGSASSLGSTASSVFTAGTSSAMPHHSGAAGGIDTLTPLTNHESSPSKRSPTPSHQNFDSSSKHVSSRNPSSSARNGLDAPHSLSTITPTPTPPTSRVEARPGPGEVKGRRIILDPELGPGKAQKIKKATYRDFGAQEFRPPPDPRLAIPGYKDGRLEPTLLEPVRMWKQRLRFSPYQLQPYTWDDQMSVGTGPATSVVVTGYDRLMPEAQLRAFFSSFGEISSLMSMTDPVTGTPLSVCSVQYRDSRRGASVAAADAAKRAEAEGNGARIGTSIIRVERDRVGRKAERAVQKEASRVRDRSTKEQAKNPQLVIPEAPAKAMEAASPAPPKNAPKEPKGLIPHAPLRTLETARAPFINPAKVAAQNLVEASVLATIKRKPYVFIGHVHVPVMGTTIAHLKKRMKMYDWEDVRCDPTGYYIVFSDSKRGEDEAARCYRLSNNQPLFTYTMHMECQQYGNPHYERSPSPERLLAIKKTKEAEERLKKEEEEDVQEEMRQRAAHLDLTKAALEQLREELLEKIIGDVKARIAAPALYDYLDPEKHVAKRRKLNIPDPIEQQRGVGPTYLGQLAEDATNRAGPRVGPGGAFRKGRGLNFAPARREQPINAFADERRAQPPKRRMELKSLHHRLHDFVDDDESDDEQTRGSREETKENDSQHMSRRSSPITDDEDEGKHHKKGRRGEGVPDPTLDDGSGDEDWGIARKLLDPHLVKKAPEDMAVRELQQIIGTLPTASKLYKHAKRELLIRQRSKADDRLFHIKSEDQDSMSAKDVTEFEMPDADSHTELDIKKKPKTKRRTKKQILEEREAAKSAALLTKALVQDEAATPDSFAIDQHEVDKIEQEAEDEFEERADVEWGVSTDMPRRTVEDDPTLVLDIDGWQHLVKDDEDFNFLMHALKDTSAAQMLDANQWALEQKEIKALNSIGLRGPGKDAALVDGYYIPNSTGSIRTEGINKIFESEKSKYLPHRLKVAAAREKRAEAARNNTSVVVAAETQRQGKLAANATGRAARASNRTQVKDINTTKQNLTEGQQGDSIRFNNLKKRKKLVKFDRSAIHGWGLYAEENIAMNDMIIEYVGEKVRQAVANIREIKYDKQGMGSSYLFRIDEDAVVDATKKGGIARFINHSCAPNCTAKIIRVDGTKRIVIYALKDITKDDELTYDYKFDREMNNDDRIPCLCGSELFAALGGVSKGTRVNPAWRFLTVHLLSTPDKSETLPASLEMRSSRDIFYPAWTVGRIKISRDSALAAEWRRRRLPIFPTYLP
ncbi:hypothetical protein FH972_021039 [Carpinus fangiana]|uniref:[histone H3]-lysine(4) N-trimethyltransferase n=1 Tax=Carpinus fangiana TaxID=176857 RepID=A0A5N6KNT3_9ROSI|nr:hypothetical protein FH972_021039 [Carpinus fangiana]